MLASFLLALPFATAASPIIDTANLIEVDVWGTASKIDVGVGTGPYLELVWK